MEEICTTFAALSDPTRLRCLALMAKEGELCVCELTCALQTSQPKMSKHLAYLREAGLVGDRRSAQWVFNGVRMDLAPWVAQALGAAVAAMADDPTHLADLERLRSMTGRPERIHAA